MSDIYKKLAEVQKTLNAPKSQYNNFGKYSYRNCEDILMAVKPLLGESSMVISDEIVCVGDRFYVKATASFMLDGASVCSTAYAREPISKKGMDESQITGAASSYARKYALNGLLLIDDSKDADSMQPTKQADSTSLQKALREYLALNTQQQNAEWPKYTEEVKKYICENINNGTN